MSAWRCNSFHGHVNGSKKSPEYRSWEYMFKRCEKRNHPSYANYGGRGIRVCERWRTFTNFLADMGNKPSPNHTLDRIDNDKNYEPANCQWASRTSQNLNKRHKIGVCGLAGVTKWGKKFAANIAPGGKKIRIGVFNTPGEASVAYEKAKELLIKQENSAKPCPNGDYRGTATEIRDGILAMARSTVPENHASEVIFHALQIACEELSKSLAQSVTTAAEMGRLREKAKADRFRHLEGTPDETKLCYLYRGMVRVMGNPKEGDGHDCDEMGCGSCGDHVLRRFMAPKESPAPAVAQAEAQVTLSEDQRAAVVATWIFRHKGAIEQEPVWALNNLACDVLRAVDDLNHGRPIDVLGVLAAAQPSGEGAGR